MCSAARCSRVAAARRFCSKHGAREFCFTVGFKSPVQVLVDSAGGKHMYSALGLYSFGNCTIDAAAARGRRALHGMAGAARNYGLKVKHCDSLVQARSQSFRHGGKVQG